MAKVITASMLKTHLGSILRGLRENESFVILRRNFPAGILVSIRDYVKEHPDQYEDVQDFVDTLLEESDPAFKRSLKRSARQIRWGHYLSHAKAKRALASNRLR